MFACRVGKLSNYAIPFSSSFSIFHPFCSSHWLGIIRDNDIKSPQWQAQKTIESHQGDPVNQNIGPVCV